MPSPLASVWWATPTTGPISRGLNRRKCSHCGALPSAKQRRAPTVVLGAALLGAGCTRVSGQEALQGVWQTTEVTTTGSGARTRTIREPRTNLTIFMAGKAPLTVLCRSLRDVAAPPTSPRHNRPILTFRVCRPLPRFAGRCCSERARKGQTLDSPLPRSFRLQSEPELLARSTNAIVKTQKLHAGNRRPYRQRRRQVNCIDGANRFHRKRAPRSVNNVRAHPPYVPMRGCVIQMRTAISRFGFIDLSEHNPHEPTRDHTR
jgi:hypothetical protein